MNKEYVSRSLEDMIMKCEQLQGLSRICCVAFEKKEAFSAMNAKDVSDTFDNINSQVTEITTAMKKILEEVAKEK